MTGPGWLVDTLAAVMLSVAAYCVSRLICARPRGRATERDVDTAHGAEGVAMAGMLVPSLGLLPGVMWKAAFAAAAGWFASRAIRARRRDATRTPPPGHYLPHLMESGAMLYMLAAVPAARAGATVAGMGGPGGGFGAGAFVFALFLLGHAVWTADRFTTLRAPAPGLPVTGPPPLAPRLAGCRQIAVSVTMAYMLITML
ncbi:MAG: DUF5134 domain-containing protein [Actinobacteria bacterium]|nr:DUF5134 domain-containing protein [Actinomycetota bacterium]